MPLPLLLPVEEDSVQMSKTGEYSVLAWNNEITKFNDVVGVFVISCGYSEERAIRYATRIHKEGRAICFWGTKHRCEEIVADFGKIGVIAEVISN
jgi:ATP-dependent Clp protease adapter protein ClpS